MSASHHEVAPIVKKTMNTAKVSSGRATFLAGFTFYQIGRYSFTPGKNSNDTAYLFFCTLSCVLGILAACISTFLTYYSDRSITYNGKIEFVKLTNSWYVRGTFQCFLWGTVFYALGLSRIGWVYYADTTAKYIPFIFLILCAILIFGVSVSIATNQVKIINSVQDSSFKKDSEEIKEIIKTNKNLPKLLSTQCNLIASRSLFVAGMIQNGIMRYRPIVANGGLASSYDGSNSDDDNNNTGHCYLVFCSIATSLALFAAMTLSTLAIFIEDCPSEISQIIYAKHMQSYVSNIIDAFNSSIIFFIFGIILMPWGCAYPLFHPSSVVLGIGSLLFILFTQLYTRYSSNQVNLYPVRSIDEETAEVNATRYLTRMNQNGSQATLASSFVFYNIVTFYTDVAAYGESHSHDPYYSYIFAGLFLIANNFAIIAGMTSAIIDVLITNKTIGFSRFQDRYQFLIRCKGLISLVDIFFYVALSGWFAVFILFGLAKFNVLSYIPMSFGFIGMFLTVGGVIYMSQATTWIKYIKDYVRVAEVDHPDNNIVEDITEERLQQYANRQSGLNSMAFNTLFLGGFAYNAVNFFSFQDNGSKTYYVIDRLYLSLMSISFVLSLSIVTWTAFYNVHVSECNDSLEKYYLARYTSGFYRLISLMSYLVILTLIFAFTMIGWMKDHSYYVNFEATAPIMFFFSILSFIIAHRYILTIKWNYDIAKTVDKTLLHDSISTLKAFGDFSHTRMLEQMGVAAGACSFVAGNVCYEILFSVANAPTNYKGNNIEWLNEVYFSLINWTFAAGVAVVAVESTCNYFMQQLEYESQRMAFGRSIKFVKYRIVLLTASALSTWMLSISFIGLVKYYGSGGPGVPLGDNTKAYCWWPSLLFGLLGTVAFWHMAINLKVKSNGIVAREEKGDFDKAIYSDWSPSFSKLNAGDNSNPIHDGVKSSDL